jgi:NitT/TauT family transport system permease protein
MIIVCYCNNIWNHSGQKTLGLQDNYSRYRYSIVCPYSLIFPAAFEFFITLSKESSIGIEMAAIFLISTSMVWNMIFSVYGSVLSIPSELLETIYAYRANPFLRLRRLCLPASIPKLIYNSIMSWTAGWYFLTAAEIISLGSNTFTLYGLGSLLGTYVSSGQFL